MKHSRTRMVALLAFLTLGTLLAGWFRTGWRSTRSEAESIRDRPEISAREELNAISKTLSSRLRDLLLKEDERPYYHYKNLFHDPRGRSQGLSVNLSPLVDSTGDELISAHFQIGSDGKLTIPPINEELSSLSQADSLSANQERLLALRAAQSKLLDAPLVVMRGPTTAAQPMVAQVDPVPAHSQQKRIAQHQQALIPPQQAQQEAPALQQAIQRQQVFEQQAFAQNAVANTVFRELENQAITPRKQQGGQNTEARTPTAAETMVQPASKPVPKKVPKRGTQTASLLPDTDDTTPVEVSTHPFSWRTTVIDGKTTLVAMRRIETPTGQLTQGFVVGVDQLSEWLRDRGASDTVGTLRYLPSGEARARLASYVAVPPLEGWALTTDYAEAQSLANTKAAGLRASFLWKFLPATLASMAMLVMIVVLVSRAESLATERSQFAAAAAHELRTPLAGLQLYGDMLADGLGDKDAKEKYARHIADEAQRLGRVVSNVLDFSQMEQGGLQLRPQQGNLSETVRRVAERMKHALDLAGMKLELELPAQALANYDDDAVYRILQNLMDNAEKYSRDHEDRTLRLAIEVEEEVVRVSVSDGGPGVLTQMRQQIFQPFRRAGGRDSPAGLGLGLALARSLAQQQGGNLRAEDSAFGGARFVLEIPKS